MKWIFTKSATIIATITSIVLIVLTAWVLLHNLEVNTKKEIGKSLATVLNTTHHAVEVWSEQKRNLARTLAEDAELVNLSKQLIANQRNNKSNSALHEKIKTKLEPVLTTTDFQGFVISDLEFNSLLSSNNSIANLKSIIYKQPHFPQTILQGQPALSLPLLLNMDLKDKTGIIRTELPTMFVAAPIKDRGTMIASLIFRVDPNGDFSELFSRGRIGDTGETYAFNRQAVLITRSRFLQHLTQIGLVKDNTNASLNIHIRDPGINLVEGETAKLNRSYQPMTTMAKSATLGNSSMNTDGYRDYRGVPVIGAWLWDDKLHLGMTTEIDIAEAYAGYYSTRNFIFIAMLIAIILISILSIIFSNFNKELEIGVRERTLALARSQSRLQNLQRTTSSAELSFDEKLEKMLSLGLRELNLDIGIVSKITANDYEVFSVVCPDNVLSKGTVFELSNTYCALTIQRAKPTWTEHAIDSPWKNHPCYKNFQLETYIGTPILVKGKTFGTLNFTSPSSRDKPFTTHDVEFIQLMAQWIELEIERQLSAKDLQDNNEILSAITYVQSRFISEVNNRTLFGGVLQKMLELSSSEYGFIGEVFYTKENKPYLKIHTSSRDHKSETNKSFYNNNTTQEIDFDDLASLFGDGIKNGEAVINNELMIEPQQSKLPGNHPSISTFLGLPIFNATRLVGVAGVANRTGGYKLSEIDYLQPFITTCANLLTAFNTRTEAKATEETIRLLMESASEGIYGLDLNGCTTFVNPAVCRMLGYSQEELLARPMHSLIHHSYADGTPYPREQSHIYASFTKGTTNHIDNEVLWRKDGSSFPIEYTSTPILKDDKVVGAVVVFTDTTQRRKAEQALLEQKQKTEHILETSKDAYLAINHDWKITYANKQVSTLISADPAALVGITLSQCLPEVHHNYQQELEKVMLGGESENITRYYEKTGKWLDIQINPSKEGLTVYFRDVTQNKLGIDALRNKEKTIRSILDTVVDGIITVNKSGIVESFNVAAENIFGYSDGEVIGQNIKMLMPPPYQLEHDQYIKNYLETGKAKIIGKGREVVGRRKDGSTFPLELSVSEMMLGELKFTGVVRDITEKNRSERMLRETTATIQAILDSANFSIISTDTTGLIKTFNTGAQSMLGYLESEMVNRQTPAMLHDIDEVIAYAKELSEELGYTVTPGFETFVAKAKLGIADEHEWTYIHKDGSHIPVLLSVTSTKDNKGQLTGFLGIAVDITEQKINETMKDEFISTVSHELRTPLTSIRGSLGLVMGGATGDLPGSIRSLVNIAYKNTDRLLLLINDILDINKIESGNMPFRFKPIAISEFLKHSLEVNQGYAEQEGVTFTLTNLEEDAYVYADEDRLLQVMNNLLSNAAKFSPAGSEVTVSSSRIGSNVRISVCDRGPGIPDTFKDKVFDKFTQQDSSDTRKVGGTGLGLSITQAIINKHNGRINFASNEEVGTVFYFDLPVLEDIGMDMSNINQLDLETRAIHPVLITEDDPHIANLLKIILTQAGFDADIALTAQAAKDLAHTRKYDAMTLDLMLPDKDGIELFHEMRRDELTRDLPIIIISAIANETRHRLDNQNLDVIDWLEKPIDNERLIASLQRALAKQHAHHPNILHIDNNPDMEQLIDTLFSDLADVRHVATLREAKSQLDEAAFDVAVLELDLPDGSGLEILKHERVVADKTRVIIFTDHAPSSDSADRLKAVLLKSQTTPEELLSTLRSSLSINQ